MAGLALAVAWLVLAPPQLGGGTSYAVVVGDSMEPLLGRGDLALIRSRAPYRVGDVVAYRSQELGTTVLHRIDRFEGDRYVLKGDNNRFVDPDRPTSDAVVGTLWLTIPHVGHAVGWLQSPVHAAVIAGALAFLTLVGGAGARTRRRRRVGALPASVPRLRAAFGPAVARKALAASAVLGLACAGLALVSFARPVTTQAEIEAPYEHVGTFGYSATGADEVVYPGGLIRPGDPVFFRLVDELRVEFAYHLRGTAPRASSGSGSLVAELADGQGWTRRVVLQPETPFAGDRVTLRGRLDLVRLRALAERFEGATGAPIDTYRVRLLPSVRLNGGTAGQSAAETFAPALLFWMDDVRLNPAAADADGTEDENTLVRSKRPTALNAVPASLRIGTVAVDVAHARAAGLAGALVAILAAVVAGLAGRVGHADEPTRIELEHGGWLLPVVRGRERTAGELVEVETFEGLLRLAERHDRLIQHEQRDGVHAYVLEEGGVAYRYEIRRTEPAGAIALLSRLAAGPKARRAA